VQAEQRRQAELEAKLKKKDAVIAGENGRGALGTVSGCNRMCVIGSWISSVSGPRRTELLASRLVAWIGISASKICDWKPRYGRVNEHNAWIPRDHWQEDWEKHAIGDFYQAHPNDGYRRATYIVIDANIVAVSPSSVYRVLGQAGVLRRSEPQPGKKGAGFA